MASDDGGKQPGGRLLPGAFRTDGQVPLAHLRGALASLLRAYATKALESAANAGWKVVPALPPAFKPRAAMQIVLTSMDPSDRAFAALSAVQHSASEVVPDSIRACWGAALNESPGFRTAHPGGPSDLAFPGWSQLAMRLPGDGMTLPSELLQELLDTLDHSLEPLWSRLEAADTALATRLSELFSTSGKWPYDTTSHYLHATNAIATLRKANSSSNRRSYASWLIAPKVAALLGRLVNDSNVRSRLNSEVFYLSNAPTLEERFSSQAAFDGFLTIVEGIITAVYNQTLSIQSHSAPVQRGVGIGGSAAAAAASTTAPRGPRQISVRLPSGQTGVLEITSDDPRDMDEWGDDDDGGDSDLVAALQGQHLTKPQSGKPQPASAGVRGACYNCGSTTCNSRNPDCPLRTQFRVISDATSSHLQRATALEGMAAYHRSKAAAVRRITWADDEGPPDHRLGEEPRISAIAGPPVDQPVEPCVESATLAGHGTAVGGQAALGAAPAESVHAAAVAAPAAKGGSKGKKAKKPLAPVVQPSTAPSSAAPPSPAALSPAAPQSADPANRAGRALPVGMPQRPLGSPFTLATDPSAICTAAELQALVSHSMAELRTSLIASLTRGIRDTEHALLALLQRSSMDQAGEPVNAVAMVSPGPRLDPGSIRFRGGGCEFAIGSGTIVQWDSGAGNTCNASALLRLTVVGCDDPARTDLIGTSLRLSSLMRPWTGVPGGFRDANGGSLPSNVVVLDLVMQGTRGGAPSSVLVPNLPIHELGDRRPVILLGVSLCEHYQLTSSPCKLSLGLAADGQPSTDEPWFLPNMALSAESSPRAIGDPVLPLDSAALQSILDEHYARRIAATDLADDPSSAALDAIPEEPAESMDDDSGWQTVGAKHAKPKTTAPPDPPDPTPAPPHPALVQPPDPSPSSGPAAGGGGSGIMVFRKSSRSTTTMQPSERRSERLAELRAEDPAPTLFSVQLVDDDDSDDGDDDDDDDGDGDDDDVDADTTVCLPSLAAPQPALPPAQDQAAAAAAF